MSIFKVPVPIAKKMMGRGEKKFNDSHKSYGDYNVKANLSYIDDDEQGHKLDIYTPTKNNNGITLLYIHGGAYVHGWKETNSVFISWFVNQGFSVVSMNYRLAGGIDKINVKDQIQDVFAVLKFISENRLYYGISKDKLCIMGDSSGGHLSLMTDIIFHDKEAQQYYGINELPDVKISAIAVNSTMYDYVEVVKLGRKMLTKRGCKELFSKEYKNEEYVLKNSPRYYFKKKLDLEPLFGSSSSQDFFQYQSYLFKKDCEKLGYSLEYIFESTENKKVGHIYNHFLLDEEEGLRCNNAMVEFFKKNIKD